MSDEPDRDRAIQDLTRLVLSMKSRLDDLTCRVEAVKLLALPADELPNEEFQKVLRAVGDAVAAHAARQAEDEATARLHRWLENHKGPVH